jgi:MoxR-like ATPase
VEHETPNLEQLQAILQAARAELAKVIIGQSAVIEAALLAILTRSHVLIEGVPGVAKTLLVKTLGQVLDCPCGRIQFTPDLMPADITGTNVFNLQTQDFKLIKGPVFTTFLLADEINRAPAKTQSALLQAMQERCVSIDQDLHRLDPNFTVFATQNPVEYEGTYPLAEAQKDRFMLKIRVDYPTEEEERELARRMLGADAPEVVLERGEVRPVVGMAELAAMRETIAGVTLKPELIPYAVEIVRATRRHEAVMVGAGPRATQYLVLAARAAAVLEGRDFVTPDDIKRMSGPVLEHRLILRPEFEVEGLSGDELINRILETTTVPR